MAYQHNPGSSKKHHLVWAIEAVALILIVVVVAILVWKPKSQNVNPSTQPDNASTQQSTEKDEEPEVPEFDVKKLSSALNSWVKGHGGAYGVTIMDKSGDVLAESGGKEAFFTASIYKLYVAYIGYQKIDDGTYKSSETYLNGWSRGKCLEEMIRQSHSPCAERLWVELGKSNLTAKLETYGLKNTDMEGLVTSSRDAAIILARLESGKDLSESSRKKLLDSMHVQIYRDALPEGFAEQEVYDKVGFRENVEYHDTAIVRFKDGRSLIVSVLTKNAGTSNIAGLAKVIAEASN